MDGEKNWVMNRIGQKMNLLDTRLDREINLSKIETKVLDRKTYGERKHIQANYSNVSV